MSDGVRFPRREMAKLRISAGDRRRPTKNDRASAVHDNLIPVCSDRRDGNRLTKSDYESVADAFRTSAAALLCRL